MIVWGGEREKVKGTSMCVYSMHEFEHLHANSQEKFLFHMHFLHVNIYNPWWLLDTFWLVSEKRVNVSLDFVCLLLCLKEFT